ncbi:MAG: polyprenyl synthetase family protein [Clostridia bacterium]|nr:polyprenyl synthetase family protein [Clostridia bacterium]MBO5670154.1 polyprenyl synthetase family protein [Clostridia bacterium]
MYEELQSALRQDAADIESALCDWLSPAYSGDTVLAQAMRYAVLGGGKRIRGFLALSFCRLFGGEAKMALPFACAIEMIHAYSLVHDDMPCMDNDDMRRGKASCHRAFGEANALLAGDTLLTQAFEVASLNMDVSEAARVRAVRALAQGAGALGMAGGQYYDLSDTCASYEELYRLQSMKTGALIRTACLLGYYAATDKVDPKDERNIAKYAEGIGFAFQIVDDLLDVRSDAITLGKPIGSDAKNDKKTILSFLSEADAEQLAARCTSEAKAALADYPGAQILCDLADYLLERRF